MSERQRIDELEDRLVRIEARATIVEVVYGGIAGLILRAAPEDVRSQVLSDLRASVSHGGAPGQECEFEALHIEELAAQIIDAIEGMARGSGTGWGE